MKKAARTGRSLSALICLISLAFPVVVRAEGSIVFLNGTQSTLRAGQPFSWMKPGGGDWIGTPPPQMVAGRLHAVPVPSSTLPRGITVVTSRTGTHLVMVFTIEDKSRTRPPGSPNSTLPIGDKIIIQIDPDNSGHLAGSTRLGLGAANNLATDYRFEIIIKDSLINAAGFKLPRSAPDGMGGTQHIWSVTRTPLTNFADLQLLPNPMAPDMADQVGADRYRVTANIRLDLIGNPTNDIGIAFAVLNDLGHEDDTTVSPVADMTGSVFPLSMGLDLLVNDPALVDTEQASGNWIIPSRWGTGHFSLASTPQDVHFTNVPSYYWSDSIKISECDESDWGPIPSSGAGTNQLMLGPEWYRYHPIRPCQMRIWLNVFKTPPGAVRRRFFIIWGRPFIGGPSDWNVVTLTEPVTLTLTDEKSFITWENVPAITFTSHPCLRAYILPEALNTAFDQNAIRAIRSQTDLDNMERVYGIQPNVDDQSAQMNFTAVLPGTSCPAGSPCACLDKPTDSNAPAEALAQFIRAGFNASDGTQPITDMMAARPPAADASQTAPRDNQTIRITAEGYAVTARGLSRKPYTYLEPIGGVGWNINHEDLVKQQQMNLEFDITNPALLQRDFTQSPPVEIRAPRRAILLMVDVKASPGTPLPTIVSRPPNQTLNPGETVKGVITIAPGTGTTPPPGTLKRFGLSLHAGVSIPHGNFGNSFAPGTDFDPGPNVAVDLEYRVTRDFSLEAIFGYHHFSASVGGDDLNLLQVSGNGKYYFTDNQVRPFFNFGGGVYHFDPGPTQGGLNVGTGVQFNISPTVAIEGLYNFHNVFTAGSDTRFSTAQGGVRFRF